MLLATFAKEQEYWDKGYQAIVGIDEVGRGSWAGPVVCAGVVFSPNCVLDFNLADSKLLPAKKREELSKRISESACAYTIAETAVEVINEVGIGQATQITFRKVLDQLHQAYDFIFMDAFYINQINKSVQLPIPHGDQISASIAAASIIAKVYRDNLLTKLHDQYPAYGFNKHMGYGTKAHQEAIKQHGLSSIHRTSFRLEKFCA